MNDDVAALRAAEQAFVEMQVLQRAGDHSAAYARLRRAVALEPSEPGVLYVSGVFAHDLGRLSAADAFLHHARQIAPGTPEIMLALGNLRLTQGAPAAAEQLFRDVIERQSGLVLARCALSAALSQSGRYREAEAELASLESAGTLPAESFLDLVALRLRRADHDQAASMLRRVLSELPQTVRAHFLHADLARREGSAAQALRDYRRAASCGGNGFALWQGLALLSVESAGTPEGRKAARRALALQPNDSTSWHVCAEAERKQARWQAAAEGYRRSLAIDPRRIDALVHLGNSLDELDQRVAAAWFLRAALAIEPENVMALSNLATVLLQDGDTAGAHRLYRQAATLAPANPIAQYNLGNAFRHEINVDAALTRYRRATALKPTYATAHWNDAIVSLMAGNWQEGFLKYEWRWRDKDKALPSYAPWWQGQSVEGRRILLLAEQGYGDMINFARYVALVCGRGANVVLECYPELRRLFSTLPGNVDLVGVADRPGPIDMQAALMQLPQIFGTTPDNVPASGGYLSVLPGGPVLPASDGGLKVGFVWAGNPRIEKFHKRSALLAEFMPLVEMAGIVPYSLQVGPRASDIASLGMGSRLADLSPLIRDFADTASLLSQMDLLISVDTATAHVAGAIGKKVWMLPTYVPDWRWMLDRDDTPWYKSMRLYRQSKDRAWPAVISRVACDLEKLTASFAAGTLDADT